MDILLKVSPQIAYNIIFEKATQFPVFGKPLDYTNRRVFIYVSYDTNNLARVPQIHRKLIAKMMKRVIGIISIKETNILYAKSYKENDSSVMDSIYANTHLKDTDFDYFTYVTGFTYLVTMTEEGLEVIHPKSLFDYYRIDIKNMTIGKPQTVFSWLYVTEK